MISFSVCIFRFLPRRTGQHLARLLSSTKTRQDGAPLTRATTIEIIDGTNYKYQPGKVYNDFTCTRAERIPEFNLTSYIFSHNTVGSQFSYIDRNDSNNVFSINFRTTPFDSTGLPHILEHNVLCGSEKFPVREPFFKMLNRSMSTYMNAMTGADYTLYPFASMNECDFRNLQQIYLDAVFKPNLSYLDFLQEGWRIEHTNLHDRKSPYTIKGVVYNEMKGVFSENSSIFGQRLLNSILPDHTYGFVSGGNPLEIPKLTHEDLVAFHRKYYHPSNARFYSYGNFNLEKTMEYMNEQYLCNYKGIDNSYSKIPNQKRWNEPRHVHVSCRYDTMGAPFERQNQIAVALLMSDITDVYETFVLELLNKFLISGPNSPFYKSMIEPNFSGGYNRITGFEQHLKDTMFSLGLQDLRVEDFSRFQEIFDKTIEEVIQKGFEKDHIESILHNYELGIKHQTPRFGLGLLFNVTPLWNHDGDVISALKVSGMLKKLRENLAIDPKYLQKKVECYFKENKHRLTLTMSPDENYEKKFSEAEKKLLDEKVAKLTEEEKKTIYENGLALETYQKAPVNIDVLPILSLDDVRSPPEPYCLQEVEENAVKTHLFTVPTNQIVYFKCIFNGSSLSKDDINLIPLFCSVINKMGTRSYNYRTLDKIIKSKTNGIHFQLHFAENINDIFKFDIGVFVSVYALSYNSEWMFELVHEVLKEYKMDDKQRLQMLLENYVSNLNVGIANMGHLYAMQSCAGLVTKSAKLKAELTGLGHIDYMKKLLQGNSTDELLVKLDSFGRKLFSGCGMKTAIHTSEDVLPTVMEPYRYLLRKIPWLHTRPLPLQLDGGPLPPECRHYITNIPVNYCAKSFLAVPYTHPHHPVLTVLSNLLSARYLLPVVREQNGAYGAGAKIGQDGIFSFFSYRDPNSSKTLDAFDNTYSWFQQNDKQVNDQTLFEAKLGVLRQIDAPVAPGNKGIENFVYGVTQEIFEKYRQGILDITIPQLKEVVETYFRYPAQHHANCVIGPENKELQQRPGEIWSIHGQ